MPPWRLADLRANMLLTVEGIAALAEGGDGYPPGHDDRIR